MILLHNNIPRTLGGQGANKYAYVRDEGELVELFVHQILFKTWPHTAPVHCHRVHLKCVLG